MQYFRAGGPVVRVGATVAQKKKDKAMGLRVEYTDVDTSAGDAAAAAGIREMEDNKKAACAALGLDPKKVDKETGAPLVKPVKGKGKKGDDDDNDAASGGEGAEGTESDEE